MNIRKLISIVLSAALAIMVSSCQMDKHLSASDHVLRDNSFDIQISDSSIIKEDIVDALKGVRNYAVQSPNSRILGVRAKMIAYCMTNPEKDHFPHKWMRKIGEAPVVIDANATQSTTNQIRRLLDSKGCFGSQVTASIKERRHHGGTVIYTITPTQRYIVDEITYRVKTPDIDTLLAKLESDSKLKVGRCYDQSDLAAERERIASALREEGYFMATPDLVSFFVDTTYERGRLSIEVILNNPKINGEERRLEKYRIDQVYIFPNGNRSNGSKVPDTLKVDYKFSSRNATFQFVSDTTMSVRPEVICRALFLATGWTYRPRTIKNTYNSLMNLKNFKYIGIDMKESPLSKDSLRLVDAYITLQNNTRQKLSASLELSNMSHFGNNVEESEDVNFLKSGSFGLETVLEYQNKNLFGGAELFKAEASLLVELPKLALLNNEQNQFHDIFSSFEAGLKLSLNVPKFILPFTNHIVWQRARPHTMVSLGSTYQYRSYFERFLVDASFGYNWSRNNRQTRAQNQHQLFPIEVAFVRFFNLDPQFIARLEGASDLRLKYQYSDHFIMDARYNYIYTTQQLGTRNSFSAINASVETAGNILQGASLLFSGQEDENGIRQIFGVPYSQYAKVSLDAKRYIYHNKKNTLVARLMAGIGLPYANSLALPYEKSFFGGGPSTMRAWQLRRLGPGGYQVAENLLERIGDISIVMNLEERFPIIGPVEGAIFVDAGNVWLMNMSDDYPKGEWDWTRFYKEIAVGTGLGVRLNVSVITVRCDFAIPLFDPGYESGQAWRFPHWKFNQIVTNFGIDYPF